MIAFLFPGQGAQYPGMGAGIAAREPAAARLFARASAVLGFDLLALCVEGSEEQLRATENTQPAILVTSLACAAALEARGIRPSAAAGLSLGEYAALAAAGSLGFEDAVALVRRRGLFMQDATAGLQTAMAALIGLDDAAVERLCRAHRHLGVVEPANFNGAGQVVIGGDAAAVKATVAAAKQAGARRAVLLSVSAPFHTSLMAPAAARLAPLLTGATLRDAAFPVVANASGEPVQSAPDIRDLLIRQVASPVQWERSLRALTLLGADTFVEVGPGTTLSGLVRKSIPGVAVRHVEDARTLDDTVESLGARVS
ncbi:MAG TPA: ACP S-malonyltransferase [bacterium]|jgi:[acyl-carrier-protein] S-malonyltransferase|nr:ACP S-malonyltransferase [bacterium]